AAQVGFGGYGLGQYPRILDRHAATLTHHRRAGVGGVPDEDHAAGVPLLLLDPLDPRAVDLLVAAENAEVLAHRRAEMSEPVPQALQAAGEGVARVIGAEIAEPVGMARRDRAQPEEASLTQPELHTRGTGEGDGGDAAPGN